MENEAHRPSVFQRRRRFLSLVAVTLFGVASMCVVFLISYAYYVNQWAAIVIMPLGVLSGIVFGIVFVVGVPWLCYKRLVFAPLLLCLMPIAWWLAWNYLARPDGIWVNSNSKKAYASLFLPQDATGVRRQLPQRHGQASFQVDFFSKQTLDELTSFYTNTAQSVNFSVLQVKDVSSEPGRPCRAVCYVNGTGQICIAWISDNSLLKGFEKYRTVRVEWQFTGSFLNPPIVAF